MTYLTPPRYLYLNMNFKLKLIIISDFPLRGGFEAWASVSYDARVAFDSAERQQMEPVE